MVDLRDSALAYLLWAQRRRVYRPRDDGTHRVIQLSQFFGLNDPAAPGLWLGEQQVNKARSFIPHGGLELGVGPTANWGGKQWAAGKFAEVVLRLTAPGAILDGARVAVF